MTSNSASGQKHKTTVQKGEAQAQSSQILFPNSTIPEGDDANLSVKKPGGKKKEKKRVED